VNFEKYNRTEDHKTKMREAKKGMCEKCAKTELLQEKHDSFNAHLKVKEATGKYGSKPTNKLTNNEGRVIPTRN
jgi:hypothetical protein